MAAQPKEVRAGQQALPALTFLGLCTCSLVAAVKRERGKPTVFFLTGCAVGYGLQGVLLRKLSAHQCPFEIWLHGSQDTCHISLLCAPPLPYRLLVLPRWEPSVSSPHGQLRWRPKQAATSWNRKPSKLSPHSDSTPCHRPQYAGPAVSPVVCFLLEKPEVG